MTKFLNAIDMETIILRKGNTEMTVSCHKNIDIKFSPHDYSKTNILFIK